jgi:hypothetical protein
MAIIYSYPTITNLKTTDLFIISRLPEDPEEISNYSVTLNSLSTYIIDKAFNGTDNYIPKFDSTNSLVNSLFYETDAGRVGLGTTTPSRKLQVAGDVIIDTDLEVDGGLDVAGTVRLGFTGNDPVILGNPTGKRTEWNNPGYFEIYAENPDSPGDFNETVDIDGDFKGGGYVGVYPVRTENRHGVRMHSRDDSDVEANFIDIASVESSAVYDENQIRLITAVDGFGTYAGIKVSHPTDNRFRFNSEFNTEPTVPFLVNSSSKFTGQVTIPVTPIDNTDAASKAYADTKVAKTGDTMTGPLNINTNGSSQLKCNNNRAVFGSHYDNANVWIYANNNGDDIYLGGGVGGLQNDVLVEQGYIYTSQGLRVGGTGAANELDDYEEGTFTPTIGSFTGGSITPVYNTQLGEYTKVGNIVTASIYISLDTSTTFSGTGDLIFSGLPYAVKTQGTNGSQVSGTLSYFRKFDDTAMGKFVGAGRSIVSTAVSLNKTVQIGSSPPDDKSTPITTADIVNAGSFYGDYVIAFTITYRT